MQENINIPDSTITTNLTFRQLVLMNMQQLTNFPYIEKDFDALTDYELLSLVVKFLNDVIANQNEQNDSITRMYQSFLALQDYVNNTKDELEDAFNNLDDYVRNYFDNLDVQDEINNKLDEMLEDGVLEQIIEQFLQLKTLVCFDNVNEMINSTNLVNGSYAQTLGYYNVNDGGKALYKIRTKTTSDIPNGGDIIQLNDTTLVAILIEKDKVTPEMFGAYGDGEHNDHQAIQKAIDYLIAGQVEFQSKTYLVGDTIIIHRGVKICGLSSYDNTNATLKLKANTNKPIIQSTGAAGQGNSHYIIIENMRIDGNGSNQTTEVNIVDIVGSFIGTIIRNCQISNYYGTGLHIQGSDLQIDNLWIYNGYTLTNRYAFDTNQEYTTQRSSMINVNNLYVENYRNALEGNPQTDSTIREHAIRINKVAGFNCNELHLETSGNSVELEDAWNVNINMSTTAYCGNTDDADNTMVLIKTAPRNLTLSNLYVTTNSIFSYWLKKASGVTNNNFKDLTYNSEYNYLPLVIGNITNVGHNSTINNLNSLNNLTIERNGTSSTNSVNLKTSTGDSSFRQNGGQYTEIGSSMNQTTFKVFQRFNSAGTAADLITFFTPIQLGERATAASIPKDNIYIYKNGNDNFPVYQRSAGSNNGMNRIVSSRIAAGAPSDTPLYIGEMYVDTTNKKAYVATGISSSSDWTIIN